MVDTVDKVKAGWTYPKGMCFCCRSMLHATFDWHQEYIREGFHLLTARHTFMSFLANYTLPPPILDFPPSANIFFMQYYQPFQDNIFSKKSLSNVWRKRVLLCTLRPMKGLRLV